MIEKKIKKVILHTAASANELSLTWELPVLSAGSPLQFRRMERRCEDVPSDQLSVTRLLALAGVRPYDLTSPDHGGFLGLSWDMPVGAKDREKRCGWATRKIVKAWWKACNTAQKQAIRHWVKTGEVLKP